MADWQDRFLELAAFIAQWSKDPSTKTGAVIVRGDKSIVSLGYNGFPKFLDDSPHDYEDREIKYSKIIHAEMNAILYAKEPLYEAILFTWPFMSCDRCAVHVIQSGITEVVAPVCPPDLEVRWGPAFQRARDMYREAGVTLTEVQ